MVNHQHQALSGGSDGRKEEVARCLAQEREKAGQPYKSHRSSSVQFSPSTQRLQNPTPLLYGDLSPSHSQGTKKPSSSWPMSTPWVYALWLFKGLIDTTSSGSEKGTPLSMGAGAELLSLWRSCMFCKTCSWSNTSPYQSLPRGKLWLLATMVCTETHSSSPHVHIEALPPPVLIPLWPGTLLLVS